MKLKSNHQDEATGHEPGCLELELVRWSAWYHSENETKEENFVDGELVRDNNLPKIEFVPTRIKRRYSHLDRMALSTIHRCLQDQDRANIPTVFVTRHGEFKPTMSLLQQILDDEPLSPYSFSHSVHNTLGGHFAMLFGNQAPSVTLGEGERGLLSGLLEATRLVRQTPHQTVLLTIFDEPIPPEFKELEISPEAPFSLSLLLRRPPVLSSSMHNTDRFSGPYNQPERLFGLLDWLTQQELPFEIFSKGLRFRIKKTST